MVPPTPPSAARKSTRVKLTPVKPQNEMTPTRPTRSARPIPPNAIAGPSTPSSSTRKRHASPRESKSQGSSTPPVNGPMKGGQESGRRVLPARIRRAAGGGQEGIRDLEEMIVDWLERWGAPCDTPPDALPIHLTTLPLSMVHPPVHTTSTIAPQPIISLTPNDANRQPPPPSPRKAEVVFDVEKIETPGWVIVRPGGDDEEAAREEMQIKARGIKAKRLRVSHHHEGGEDTSDAHYIALHKKFEIFERRQRIREREKLQFERYKMRSRIELLRNMSIMAWSTLVNTVLSRAGDSSWEMGREKLKEEDVDWLRGRLIREGQELVKRYDELLPVDPRKRTDRANSTIASTPTPERVLDDSSSLSSSPAPVLPARVSALREPTSSKRARPSPVRTSSPVRTYTPRKSRAVEDHPPEVGSEYDDPSILLPRKRRRTTLPAIAEPEANAQIVGKIVNTRVKRISLRVASLINGDGDAAPTAEDAPSIRPLSPVPAESDPALVLVPSSSPGQPDRASLSPLTSIDKTSPVKYTKRKPQTSPTKTKSKEPKARPTTRRTSLAAKSEKGEKATARPPPKERTRSSDRLVSALPFGLPCPPVVEVKEDFSITNDEDFWGIIAGREAQATEERRASLSQIHLSGSTRVEDEQDGGVDSDEDEEEQEDGMMSREEVADMREVEAVVVL